jgi:hypothetical protein
VYDAYRPHRRFDLGRRSDRAAIVAIAIAALLVLLIWSPGIGGARPGDPAAIAADARLARCGGALADVEYGFTIPHASEYARYLPAMGRFSELDINPPALVVIYRGEFPGVVPSPGAATPPAAVPLRNLCIYVGVAGQGEINYYADVSIAGLRATPAGPVLVPAVQT